MQITTAKARPNDPLVLELLKPRPLERVASRNRVVGPRRGQAHRRAQRQEVFEKLPWG